MSILATWITMSSLQYRDSNLVLKKDRLALALFYVYFFLFFLQLLWKKPWLMNCLSADYFLSLSFFFFSNWTDF